MSGRAIASCIGLAAIIVTLAAPLAAQPITQVEYDVISAAIGELLRREPFGGMPTAKVEDQRPHDLVVIIGQVDPESPRTADAVQPRGGGTMDSTALSSYASRLERPAFERRFAGIGPYQLMTLAEHRNIFESGGWHAFYDRFPRAAGLFAVSRVGVSDDGNEAILHIMNLRDGHWGSARLMLFRRQDDRWVLAGEKVLWEA